MEQNNSLSVISLVMGILGIVFAFVFAPVGLVLSIVGLVLANKAKAQFGTDGLNTGGKVLSIIGLILSIIMFIFWIIALVAAAAILSMGMMMF